MKTNRQEEPVNSLDCLYIIGDKTASRYTFLDGLKRILRIMEYNLIEKLWDGYLEKIGMYTSDSFGAADMYKKKGRLK